MTLSATVLTDCRIYCDSADLTGYSNKVEVKGMAEDLETTTFASAGYKEFKGGTFSADIKLEGLWQAGDLSQPDDTFWADLGVNSKPITFVPTPTTLGSAPSVGDLSYVTKFLETQYSPGAERGKLLAWSAEMKGNWPVARGVVLHPQGTARTTTGNGTGVQIGSVSATQRLYASLHVLSISGTSTPTITVKVQSSVDNTFASPTDRITFTAATALGGQALSVDGAVTDTWWRAVWTISGSSPSFLFAVSAGIAAK